VSQKAGDICTAHCV